MTSRKFTWPYWRMRLRAYLFRATTRWAWLRRRLKDVKEPLNMLPEHEKLLKTMEFLCGSCTSALGKPYKVPLGDCNITPLETPNGLVKTALITCPTCNCISYQGRIFDFSTGQFSRY